MPTHLHIRLSLRNSDPLIVRELEVPEDYSAYEFHLALQVSLGWNDLEPFELVRQNLTVGVEPSYAGEGIVHEGHHYRHADEVEVSELFQRVGQKLSYTYDFSRLWNFDVVLLEYVEREGDLPTCVLSQEPAPIEDADDLEAFYGMMIAWVDESLELHDLAMQLLGEDFELSGPKPADITEHLANLFGEEIEPHGTDPDDDNDDYGWWDPSKYDEKMRIRVLQQDIEHQLPNKLDGSTSADRAQELLDALKGKTNR